MKNHFIFPYFGNKRMEVEEILKGVELDNYKYIIEPFCGSFALSYYISTLKPRKYTYILNDNDKYLIELLKLLQDKERSEQFINTINKMIIDIDKEKYNAIIKRGDIYGYYIKHKIFKIRIGLFPIHYKPKVLSLDCPVIDFLRNEKIELYCDDGVNILNKYKNDADALMFLDPPYLVATNSYYENIDIVHGYVNIYEHLVNDNFSKYKCKLLICLDCNWMIKYIFKDYIVNTYEKRYVGYKKRKTIHCVITNRR